MNSDISHFNNCNLQQGSDAAKNSEKVNQRLLQEQLVDDQIVIRPPAKAIVSSGDEASKKRDRSKGRNKLKHVKANQETKVVEEAEPEASDASARTSQQLVKRYG